MKYWMLMFPIMDILTCFIGHFWTKHNYLSHPAAISPLEQFMIGMPLIVGILIVSLFRLVTLNIGCVNNG